MLDDATGLAGARAGASASAGWGGWFDEAYRSVSVVVSADEVGI